MGMEMDMDMDMDTDIDIKLSTVALEIPSCSGKARGARFDLVSCFERA